MDEKLIEKILKLKKEKDAVILVHNYQRPEIYEVADFIGDSLELAKAATEVKKDIIVFCGVDFMAESAKILNPEKKVLIPSKQANCPMAGMISGDDVRNWKKEYPDAAVVSYVNTNAKTKAESDICCTSANTVKVVNSLEESSVLFCPDKNLAAYAQTKSDKKIIPWEGHCYVHSQISLKTVITAKVNHPDAEFIAHPECLPEVITEADAVCSTSQMIDYVRQSSAKEFILGTESGMINRLKREVPDRCYFAVGSICIQMKKITLDMVYETLQSECNEILVDEEIRKMAKIALDRMMEL